MRGRGETPKTGCDAQLCSEHRMRCIGYTPSEERSEEQARRVPSINTSGFAGGLDAWNSAPVSGVAASSLDVS